jgi:enoyl-CoA hydratase
MSITSERVAEGTVVLITMDDGKANALSKQAIADLVAAVDAAESDSSVVAAVIAGREGKFSAGFDLNVMRSGDFPAMVDLVADGGDLVRHLYSSNLPIVAACTGHALAAGAFMLLGCDLRIGASGDYKIGMNEVAIGMVLPDWAMTISRERISKRHLQRAVATARITDADGAVDVGFIDIVVPMEDVVSTAIAEATSFAALDRGAYAKTMENFRGEVTDEMAAHVASDRAAI